jgi:hypothetical protein
MDFAKINQDGGWVRAKGGGKVAIATPPSPTDICVTHIETSKICVVNATAWHFGPED